MINLDTQDLLFSEAVSAIDTGDVEKLEHLLTLNPELVNERLETPGTWLRNTVGSALDGYFQRPYLLWFVADNPVRVDKLPSNIDLIVNAIITAIKQKASDSFQHQLDYTLGLVVTGRIPRECRVQTRLIDLLIDAGAKPGGGVGALAHGNPDAAGHLIERGAKLTLPVAVCLERMDDVMRLLNEATGIDLQVAFTAAAFYGKTAMLTLLIGTGVDINAFPDSTTGFHSHATALHQAVFSGSPEAVKVLIEAGANAGIRDRIYNATPLDWAEHMLVEERNDHAGKNFATIAAYLRDVSNSSAEGVVIQT